MDNFLPIFIINILKLLVLLYNSFLVTLVIYEKTCIYINPYIYNELLHL